LRGVGGYFRWGGGLGLGGGKKPLKKKTSNLEFAGKRAFGAKGVKVSKVQGEKGGRTFPKERCWGEGKPQVPKRGGTEAWRGLRPRRAKKKR